MLARVFAWGLPVQLITCSQRVMCSAGQSQVVDSNGNLITVCPSGGGSGGGGGGAPGAPGAPGASHSCTSAAKHEAYGALPRERSDWDPIYADQVHSCKAQMEAWGTASTLLPASLLGG